MNGADPTKRRQEKVADAAAQLPAALHAAQRTPTAHADYPARWELVEKLGATIHRQARLLAGKSKGG